METKSQETGVFKVTGWGCDALWMKSNVTITRCNSKGDPSNTGQYLVVNTTSKPMSFRFNSEGEWENVAAYSKNVSKAIPAHLLSEKAIVIQVVYTPS